MKIIQGSWKIWFRKGILKNHSSKFNRAKLDLSLIMAHHPNKPGKIWVIFDCSAEYNGVSIIKKLISGPDLINQIISILVKFRKNFVAIMADREAMF